MLYRVIRSLLVAAYVFFATTFLAFALLELYPSLLHRINLGGIGYYAMLAQYVPDPTLVFVRRNVGPVVEYDFKGDMSAESESPSIHYVATYTPEGFRTSSSTPPYDVVLMGDSYLEIGESDGDTLSERLKAASGLATLNLGTGWYGPYQYLELFKRYGLASGAKVALLCFFDGNDIEDVRQYAKWLNGGDYYHYVVSRRTLLHRYLGVLEELISPVRKGIRNLFGRKRAAAPGQSGVSREGLLSKGVDIRLDEDVVRMWFTYWNKRVTTDQLLPSDEWQRLRKVLADFKAVADSRGIIPMVVYIPTKLQTYGRLIGDEAGIEFRNEVAQQIQFEGNSEQALRVIARDLQIDMVDLLPDFQEHAGRGELLYYPFDTHWNKVGRQVAAEILARDLAQRLPQSHRVFNLVPRRPER